MKNMLISFALFLACIVFKVGLGYTDIIKYISKINRMNFIRFQSKSVEFCSVFTVGVNAESY